MKRFTIFTLFLFFAGVSVLASTRDTFNRANSALTSSPWAASTGQTAGKSMSIVSNAILPVNPLGVGNMAFSVFDSLITNVDSLRIGFTINHISTDAPTSYNQSCIEFGLLSSKDLSVASGTVGWKLVFHYGHISIGTRLSDSTTVYYDPVNQAYPTIAVGDTFYLEIRYHGDSAYVFRNSETTPMCYAGDQSWNMVNLTSGGYVHVGGTVMNDQSILDNFIIGKATVTSPTPPSTLNVPPLVVSYQHFPNIVDTSSSVYISARTTDESKIDSIIIYVETTENSGTYAVKKALKTLSFGTKDTTISSVATAAKYATGTYRYFVRVKDDSGAVTISPTKSFTVGVASNMWFTTYYSTWNMAPLKSANYACPPWELDLGRFTDLIHFDNGNVTQTPPYWAYMFGPSSALGPRPADAESDSLAIEFNGVAAPGDGIHFTPYQDSLITIAHRNGIRVSISIQAVTPANLSYVVTDSARTQLFVNTVIAWAERKKYDGIELDWEFWGNYTGTQPDTGSTGRFLRILSRGVRTMKTGLGTKPILTISAGSSYEQFYKPVYDVFVDQFNLQLYDYAYAYYGGTVNAAVAWHISPLFRGTDLPPTWMFEGMSWDTRGPLQWVAAGHDAKKIGLGFPTYGYILRNVDTLKAPMLSNADYGSAHYQVIEALKQNGGTEVWDDQRKVRYIHGTALNTVGTVYYGSDGINAGQKFIAVGENPQSLAEKVAWAKANKFGGFMSYDFLSDFDRDQPPNSQARHPLHYAMNQLLGAATTPVYPGVPILSSPNSGATGYPITSQSFVWRTAANATKYEFEISSTSSFITTVYSATNITDTTTIANFSPNLGYSTTYYWHVRSVNASGASSWSTAYSFVTASQFNSAPIAPALSSPADGASGQEVSVTLSWTAGDAITTSYQYQYGIDTVSSTKQILNSAVSSVILTGIGYSTVYHWHVRSVNSYGNSPWSVWRSFTTKTEPATTTSTLDVTPVTFSAVTGKVQNSAPPYMTVKQNDSANVPIPASGYANLSSSGVRFSDGSFKTIGASSGSSMMPDQIITQINLGTTSIASSRIQALGTTNAGIMPSPAGGKNLYARTNTNTGVPEWGSLPTTAGDVSSNTSVSVDGELALFSGIAGKTVRRATTSGIPKLTSGVLGAATAGVDYTTPQNVKDTVLAHAIIVASAVNHVSMMNASGDTLKSGPVSTLATTDSIASKADVRAASTGGVDTLILHAQKFGAIVDTNAAHLSWNKLDRDSIKAHNTRINALKQLALDSIAARLAWSKADRDSIAAHNTRINSKQATITNLGDTSGYAHNYDSLKLHYVLLAGKVAKADIYTIGQPMALDSSMITAGRIFPMLIGNNEIVDSVFIIAAGSACSFTANFYCSQTNFTAVDSLLSAVWSATTANGKQSKVLTDMRNSGSLATRIWWMKITTVTSKPDAVVVQMKGHRP